MDCVYVVIATTDSEVEVCETYIGIHSALGRAFQLASDKSGRGRTDLFCASPEEEVNPDGSINWCFMSTNKQSVTVHFRKVEEALTSSKCVIHTPVQPVMITNQDDLPFSWKKNAGGCVLWEAKLDPSVAINPRDLTDKQKWALVTARFKKDSMATWVQPGTNGVYAQSFIIGELLSKSYLAASIVEDEIGKLANQYDHLLLGPILHSHGSGCTGPLPVVHSAGCSGTLVVSNPTTTPIVGVTGPIGPSSPSIGVGTSSWQDPELTKDDSDKFASSFWRLFHRN